MGKSNAGAGDVFDEQRIRRLVELMNEHKLAEIDLRQGEQAIRLRRDVDPVIAQAPAAAPAPSSEPAAESSAPAADPANISQIKSPMVGTFYQASSPDDPPFIRIGDRVAPDTTACIVEAMKVFNEIPAECAGKVVAILVENGDPVEYGQPMFKVDTSQ